MGEDSAACMYDVYNHTMPDAHKIIICRYSTTSMKCMQSPPPQFNFASSIFVAACSAVFTR